MCCSSKYQAAHCGLPFAGMIVEPVTEQQDMTAFQSSIARALRQAASSARAVRLALQHRGSHPAQEVEVIEEQNAIESEEQPHGQFHEGKGLVQHEEQQA